MSSSGRTALDGSGLSDIGVEADIAEPRIVQARQTLREFLRSDLSVEASSITMVRRLRQD